MPVPPADLRVGRWVVFRPDPSLPLWHTGRVVAVRGDRVAVAEAKAITPRGRVYRAPYPSVSVLLSEVEAVLDHPPTAEDVLRLAQGSLAGAGREG